MGPFLFQYSPSLFPVSFTLSFPFPSFLPFPLPFPSTLAAAQAPLQQSPAAKRILMHFNQFVTFDAASGANDFGGN